MGREFRLVFGDWVAMKGAWKRVGWRDVRWWADVQFLLFLADSIR